MLVEVAAAVLLAVHNRMIMVDLVAAVLKLLIMVDYLEL
jgi:hypothetical protein